MSLRVPYVRRTTSARGFLNDMNGVQSKTEYRVLTGLAYAFEVPR